MLSESRPDAVARMVEMAEAAGANAVVGLKFDCSEITQALSEVAARDSRQAGRGARA